MLKADFHMHSREDRFDSWISYSAKDLIRYASKLGFSVLSLTHHFHVYYNAELASFAKKKGIVLIPGVEMRYEGGDVLVLNLEKTPSIRNLSEIEKLRAEGALIIAPHPFYPIGHSLGKNLVKHIKQFDAIEYCHFYSDFLTNMFNRKAVRVARKYHKPIVGTSDAHQLYQFNSTFSLVDAESKKEDILEAVRKGKVEYVTSPLSYLTIFRHLATMAKNRNYKK